MASIRERPTSAGEQRFVVSYRHRGRQSTLTFTRRRDAEKARDLINALGPGEALTRLLGSAARTETPTVKIWLEQHITDLTGITERTRAD